MAKLLFELLSEEIPARMQTRAAQDMQRLITDRLTAAGLGFAGTRGFAGPRRVAVVVDGLPRVRADVEEEKRGPRVGAPDNAIQGFLKGAGLASLDQAEKRTTDKGEFWFAVTRKKGGPTEDVLPQILIDAITAMSWPKSMKWGSGTFAWVRPLHSILAVFDGKPLRGQLELGGGMPPIRFGNRTRGHRFLSAGEITVEEVGGYIRQLRAARVILDPVERAAVIRAKVETLCIQSGIAVHHDEALIDEVAGLVEWPVPLMGTIDDAFMDLPPEVLTTSMRTHQRYFATRKEDGVLANRFVVVANMITSDGGTEIIAGNERVLRARLADARFFWDQDRKVTLADRLPALKDIVFHAKLGTQYERVERIVALAKEVVAQEKSGFFRDVDLMQVEQAARLCKADLVSGMVGEFPELQGTMGRYYARHEGLPSQVADAIGAHYAPQGPNDTCPTAPMAVAVALADKLDLLVSFWSIDEKPTGSRDPFGLRRAALGAIQLIVENQVRLPLSQLLASLGAKGGDLLGFFADRLKVQVREQGVRHDLVDAVFALGGEDDLVRLLARVTALQAFVGTEDGRNLLVAYNRAANIVRAEEKKEKGLGAKIAGDIDAQILQAAEEKAMAAALTDVDAKAKPSLAREDFTGAMTALAELRAPIDVFFDRVTVNADDPALRLNRLKLLNRIRVTIDRVADFSKIEG
ncbi:glycine--tRNA ligase subunit beta [Reyranella sp. CPCC 100927]|uniref:glycine--tRNA ligase subunit beta n=1 Tax=Reyranella sp. CPCC 100927 TaxID=2599616 RepID=UPI0011B75029|nr:glycine--tRNA ligase subunit beta [Reyranella sp. CPCC 100927]TWT04059.1 glycine--tRNA ligase subunit beta [Reyranella sp. CPCC 100927]